MGRKTAAPLPKHLARSVEQFETASRSGDFYAWTMTQPALLRSGEIAQADLMGIADEIEDLGKSEYAALQRDLAIVVLHILKWEFQPARRSRSWELSIREHRRHVARRLKASPSLAARRTEAAIEAYEDGRDRALAETGLPDHAIPEVSPYTWDDITTRPFIYVT